MPAKYITETVKDTVISRMPADPGIHLTTQLAFFFFYNLFCGNSIFRYSQPGEKCYVVIQFRKCYKLWPIFLLENYNIC